MQVSKPELGVLQTVCLLLFFFTRQIPYAIGQFTVNEYCHELVFRSITEESKQKISQSPTLKYSISLGSGIIAGFAAAILSHVSLSITGSPFD